MPAFDPGETRMWMCTFWYQGWEVQLNTFRKLV